MDNDLIHLTQALRRMHASLSDAIEQGFHAHKLAERALAAAEGRQFDSRAEMHIEDSKQQILQLLQKAIQRIPK